MLPTLRLFSENNIKRIISETAQLLWANYGYLVEADLDAKAEGELCLLANAHGIGFILLKAEQPEESPILIDSRVCDIDWDTVNRIAEENKDFRKYKKAVRQLCNNTPAEDHKIWYEAKFTED